MTIAVYPGSFDPMTNGHLQIALRAAGLFDELIIGVYDSPAKSLLFTTEERVQLWRDAVANVPNVKVTEYTGLTVDFARSVGAKAIVRGLRATSDFENEFQMAMMNKKLASEIEVVCLITDLEYQFVSSTLLKEVARLGGDIDSLVPKHVAEAILRKTEANKLPIVRLGFSSE